MHLKRKVITKHSLVCGSPVFAISRHMVSFHRSCPCSIAAVPEVPFMIYLGALSDKIGRKPLLVAALFSYPLRLFLYTVVSNAYLILPIQLLHGLTFGVLYVAAIAFISDITSET